MKYFIFNCILLALFCFLKVQAAELGHLMDDGPKTTLCTNKGHPQICEGENVTCCPILVNGTANGIFTCMKDEWVGCGDCVHYCNKGFKCDMANEACVSEDGTTRMKRSNVADGPNSRIVRSVEATLREYEQDFEPEQEEYRVKRDLRVTDSEFCNNGTGTLCREDFGGGCCPGEKSVCCTDNYSCCPKDSTCDTNLKVCYFY